MTFEEIVVALNQINFSEYSDQELDDLVVLFRRKASEAQRVGYFRARSDSYHDPDVMAAD